jgi:hypothetical protein
MNGLGQGQAAPDAAAPTADTTAPIPVVAEVTQTTTPGNESFTIDTTAPPPDTFVPMLEKYKDREWAQNILKSENPDKLGLFVDNFENAQKKIGEKGVQFPTDKSTPDEIANFRKAMQIPETPDGYQIQPAQGLQSASPEDKQVMDYLASVHADGMVKRMQAAAHKYNLTPQQLQGMFEEYNQSFIAEYKQNIQELQKASQDLDTDFEKQMYTTFGTRAEQVKANCRQIMQNCLPADSPLRPMMEKQSNETFLLLAAVLDGVNQKYIKEDTFTGGNFTGAGGMTGMEHQKVGMQLMAQIGQMKPNDPQYAHLQAKIAEHYRNTPKERLA